MLATSGVITEFLLLCIDVQDTSGSRLKDRPAAPSPVQITTAAPASAQGELLPPVLLQLRVIKSITSYEFEQYVLQTLGTFPDLIFPAAHPHAHTAPPSALVPVMTTAAPQPGLPGSSNAFQVRFPSIFESYYQNLHESTTVVN